MAKKPARRRETEPVPPTPDAPDVRPPTSDAPRPPALSGWWIAGAIAAVVLVIVVTRALRSEGTADAGGEREIVFPSGPEQPTPPEQLTVRVVRSYPHATDAFTQGLLWHEGHLYESTGLYRRSSLRRVELETGEVLARRALEPRLFAEGLARVGDELFLISWQEHVAEVFSIDDLEPLRRFEYEGEGWGLCYDGTHLVMSDGSDRLAFRDPETFEIVRSVVVREEGTPVDRLNELECVDGAVWANVWETDRILRIDPGSGRVTGVADASDLLSADERFDADVLNGIAWIPERGRFVITGKLWPRTFEVELVPAYGSARPGGTGRERAQREDGRARSGRADL